MPVLHTDQDNGSPVPRDQQPRLVGAENLSPRPLSWLRIFLFVTSRVN